MIIFMALDFGVWSDIADVSITLQIQISYKLPLTLTDVSLSVTTTPCVPLVVLCNDNTIEVILVWITARPAAVLYVN